MAIPGGGARPARIDAGCGATPISGWLDLDSSAVVLIARLPRCMELLSAATLVGLHQLEFARTSRQNGIQWATAANQIPAPDQSAGVVYASHRLEHLDPHNEVRRFVGDVHRMLVPGGILRVVVPDLLRRAQRYVQRSRYPNEFLRSLNL
jgi:trans-aconitate methyltransferase